MQLDNDMKILIIVDFYLLISIVASTVIHFVFQNIIDVWVAVGIGLIVALVAMFYLVRIYKVIAKLGDKK